MEMENLDRLHDRHRAQLAENPVAGEFWTEKATGADFLVKNVDTWKKGSVTIHAISVPSRRIVVMSVDRFIKMFSKIQISKVEI